MRFVHERPSPHRLCLLCGHPVGEEALISLGVTVDGTQLTVHAHKYCTEMVRFQDRKHRILTPLAIRLLHEVELEKWLIGKQGDSAGLPKGRETT